MIKADATCDEQQNLVIGFLELFFNGFQNSAPSIEQSVSLTIIPQKQDYVQIIGNLKHKNMTVIKSLGLVPK